MGRYDDLGPAARAAGLTLGTARRWELARPLDDAHVFAELRGDGYIDLPGMIPPELIAQARASIELVIARQVPAVTAFMFDPLWHLVSLITPIAAAGLGGPVELLDSFWAWHVHGDSAHGWPPHRDRPGRAFTDTGELASITLWVALADATLRNGCIYVAPAPWDYEYDNPDAGGHVSSMQHIRALPAAAGTVLGWTHALLHWGSAAAPDQPPRISVGYEFVRAGFETSDDRLATTIFPTAAERAGIIDRQITKYEHMHHLSREALAPLSMVIGAIRREYRDA